MKTRLAAESAARGMNPGSPRPLEWTPHQSNL
jgi:hypothetical protein